MKILLLVLIITSSLFAQQEPQTEIVYDKSKFIVGESINLLVTYSNKSTENIHNYFQRLYIEIITETGEYMNNYSFGEKNKRKTPCEEPFDKCLLNLSPGEEESYLYTLYDYFGWVEGKIPVLCFQPGKYLLKTFVSNGIEKKLIAEFSFEVIPPEGIDKDVYNEWASLAHIIDIERYDNASIYTSELEKLMLKYPNNQYLNLIANEICNFSIFKQLDRTEIIKRYNTVIENYLTSRDAVRRLTFIFRTMENQEEKIALIDRLIDKNSFKTIKGYLNQLKKEVVAGEWKKN